MVDFEWFNSGGGIGGLTLAIALGKYPGIHVDIYEGAAKFSELGAGIGMLRRPWLILDALGLATDLEKTISYDVFSSEEDGGRSDHAICHLRL